MKKGVFSSLLLAAVLIWAGCKEPECRKSSLEEIVSGTYQGNLWMVDYKGDRTEMTPCKVRVNFSGNDLGMQFECDSSEINHLKTPHYDCNAIDEDLPVLTLRLDGVESGHWTPVPPTIKLGYQRLGLNYYFEGEK